MKRIALALTITALAIPLLGPMSPAAAKDRHDRDYDRDYDRDRDRDRDRDYNRDRDRGRGAWHAQTSFRVGDFHFSLGYYEPARRGSYYEAPRYYYRTSSRVRHAGYQCDSGCYRHSDHYYHTPSCPLVRYHFRANRYLPPPLPYYFSPYGYGAELYYYYPPPYRDYRRAPHRSRGYRRGW